MASLSRLLYNKWFPLALPPRTTFADRTILITGATGGLGLEAAVHFVNLGARTVVITARSMTRGVTARATIEARTGRMGVVQVRELDMSTFEGVMGFVKGLEGEEEEKLRVIDIVLLNAGVYKKTYDVSPDGWEETIQVNTLSTILLGLLLLPWMRACRPAEGRQHLGFVSSGLHTKVNIGTEDFPEEDVLRYWSEEKHFLGSGTYALSKLFMMYGVTGILDVAQTTDKSSPIISTMCPGLCKSDLARQYTAQSYLANIAVSTFFTVLGKSAEAGARTFVLAALAEPEENGKYIKHYGSVNAEYQFESEENITSKAGKKLQAQIWKEMQQIFDISVPEASKTARAETWTG